MANFRRCQALLRHLCRMRVLDAKGVELHNPFRSPSKAPHDRSDGNLIEYDNSLDQLYDCMARFSPEQVTRFGAFAQQTLLFLGGDTTQLISQFVKKAELEKLKAQVEEMTKRGPNVGNMMEVLRAQQAVMAARQEQARPPAAPEKTPAVSPRRHTCVDRTTSFDPPSKRNLMSQAPLSPRVPAISIHSKSSANAAADGKQGPSEKSGDQKQTLSKRKQTQSLAPLNAES